KARRLAMPETNVVDYLVTVGSIIHRDGHWALQARLNEVELSVPDNIRRMIEKQIERLTLVEQRALEAASVAGIDFSAVALGAGLNQDVVQLEHLCDELARRHQFLRPASVNELPNGTLTMRYQFIHALYQNVLYDRVTATQRARLHQRIAEC